MTKKKKVLVVGATLLDIQVFLNDLNTDNISSSYSIGGKGYNVSKGIQLFDIPVVLATMCGNGIVGDYISKKLSDTGIEVLESSKLNHNGGVFVAVHNNHGETIIDKADTSMFDMQVLEGVDFNDISTIIVISSTNQIVLEKLIQAKKDYPNINLCLEIAGRKKISNILPIIEYFDFIIANKIESEAIIKSLDPQENGLENSLNELSKKLDCIFIATIDKDGLILSDHGNSSIYPINKLTTPIVSTVGAGDSVTASIISLYYEKEKTISESIEKAMIIASHTIRSKEPFLNQLPIEL